MHDCRCARIGLLGTPELAIVPLGHNWPRQLGETCKACGMFRVNLAIGKIDSRKNDHNKYLRPHDDGGHDDFGDVDDVFQETRGYHGQAHWRRAVGQPHRKDWNESPRNTWIVWEIN